MERPEPRFAATARLVLLIGDVCRKGIRLRAPGVRPLRAGKGGAMEIKQPARRDPGRPLAYLDRVALEFPTCASSVATSACSGRRR